MLFDEWKLEEAPVVEREEVVDSEEMRVNSLEFRVWNRRSPQRNAEKKM